MWRSLEWDPSHGSRTSCPFRLSPLTDEKQERNTMVRHSSIPLPETTAQISLEGYCFCLHDKRVRNPDLLRFATSLRPQWRLNDAPY